MPDLDEPIERPVTMSPGRDRDLRTGAMQLLDAAARVEPSDVSSLVAVLVDILSARTGRFHAADYSMRHLQEVEPSGRLGPARPVAGSVAGRAFSANQVIVTAGAPTVVTVPLLDGTQPIGALELEYDEWDESMLDGLDRLTTIFVMALLTKSRYTDEWARWRRIQPMSAAAEAQWGLLPPISCTTEHVSVGGLLEPAYELGGDSFDYAINGSVLDFAILDAVGRGISGITLASIAINSLRNCRRSGISLTETYERTDRQIALQFNDASYVTGQFGNLDLATGVLTWVNAGHVLPMLVRNRAYAGQLGCRPSWPFGLGGSLKQVATEQLQRGDRVLFYTDGMIESISPDDGRFGEDRLSDMLVRATLDELPVAQSARRLGEIVLDYVGAALYDDATLLLIEYSGGETPEG